MLNAYHLPLIHHQNSILWALVFFILPTEHLNLLFVYLSYHSISSIFFTFPQNIKLTNFLRFPPKDIDINDVLNRGNRVLLMTIDPKFSTINAVEQLAEILKNECQKTIIVLGADKETVLRSFQKQSKKGGSLENRVRHFCIFQLDNI